VTLRSITCGLLPCRCDYIPARQRAAGPRNPRARHPAGRGAGRRAAEPAGRIHAELRNQGEQVGLTTVYRHLQVLTEDGTVDTIRDASGETLYRRCRSDAHHHHLTCRRCGTSVEVEGRAVERWAEQVADEAGFTDVGHTVELFGLCPACGSL